MNKKGEREKGDEEGDEEGGKEERGRIKKRTKRSEERQMIEDTKLQMMQRLKKLVKN